MILPAPLGPLCPAMHHLDFRLYLSWASHRKVRVALIEGGRVTGSNESDTVGNKRSVSRIGYAIAVVVNLVLLFVVNNLLAWGWIPFLTDESEQLLPIVNLSLVVGAGASFAFIFYNALWFRSVGQIVQNIVSLFVVAATLKVFPFDFSPYIINWATITRGGLILVGLAIGIGTIAEFVELIRTVVPGDTQASNPS